MFSGLKKNPESDYDTGIFMRLWNVKNVVSFYSSDKNNDFKRDIRKRTR
jgi:hypothetical protein